jgi:hypothetical protein
MDPFEPDGADDYIPEEVELVDDEPVGPEPPEYRWALTWAVIFILVTLGCSFLQH